MHRFARTLVVLAVLFVPVGALAQDAATIAGIVRDASGAVLPGVTVEAASSVLIEKVRSVTTDGSGQYSIVALPPGTYSLTFSLPGFSTVKQENIQLTAAITASINTDLRVGALEETVTVTGESPIVDTRSARRQQVIDGDILQTLPTSRSYNDVLQLAPGVVAGNGQAQLRPGMLLFTAHGGNTQDGRLTLDGINTGASRGGAGVSGYIPDMQNAQEVTFTISGNLGEVETGGPQMTVIPKSGGNTFSGTALYSGFNDSMQGNNYDEKQLSVLGKYAPALLVRDYQVSLGGPIKRDRIWFFFNYRAVDAADAQAGIFANKNAGDPTKWTYEPDLTRQGRADPHRKIASLRLTTQITPKNKLMVFWDEQPQCNGAGWSDDDHCNSQKDGWIYGGSQVNGFFGPGPQLAGDGRLCQHAPERAAGEVHQHRHEQAADRSRLRHLHLAVGLHRAAGQPDDEPDSRAGTDDAVLRRQWQPRERRHSGRTHGGRQLEVPLVELAHGLHRREHVERLRQLRDRLAHHEVRVPGGVPQGRRQPVRHHHQRPAHDLPLRGRSERRRSVGRLRCAEPGDHPGRSVDALRAHRLHGALRAGPVDDRADDGAGGGAIRSRLQQVPGADDSEGRLVAYGVRDRAVDGHRCLQEHQPAHRVGLRPLRQRQDLVQGQPGTLHASGVQRRPLRGAQPRRARGHARQPSVDRCERQLRRGLRPAERGRAGSPRRLAATCAVRATRTTARTGRPPRSTRRSSTAGTRAPTIGSSASRCSRKSCRACRSRSVTTAGGGPSTTAST